jgi:hypothetical protein
MNAIRSNIKRERIEIFDEKENDLLGKIVKNIQH